MLFLKECIQALVVGFFVHEARWKESTSHAPGIPSDWLGRQLLAVTPEIFDEAGNTETQALK